MTVLSARRFADGFAVVCANDDNVLGDCDTCVITGLENPDRNLVTSHKYACGLWQALEPIGEGDVSPESIPFSGGFLKGVGVFEVSGKRSDESCFAFRAPVLARILHIGVGGEVEIQELACRKFSDRGFVEGQVCGSGFRKALWGTVQKKRWNAAEDLWRKPVVVDDATVRVPEPNEL